MPDFSGLPDPEEVRCWITEGRRTHEDPLAYFPELTVLSLGSEKYAVRGRTISYLTYADGCICPDWQHRKSISREPCRHMQALHEHLAGGPAPCAWCQGPGCYRCSGTGRMSSKEAESELTKVRALVELADARLKEVFR